VYALWITTYAMACQHVCPAVEASASFGSMVAIACRYEHSRVQISAFEAINDLVRTATRDTLDVVAQLIQASAAQGWCGQSNPSGLSPSP
jgi:hypothetical protein